MKVSYDIVFQYTMYNTDFLKKILELRKQEDK